MHSFLPSATKSYAERCVLLKRGSVLPPGSSGRNQARGETGSKTEESRQTDNTEAYLPSANTGEEGRLSADRFTGKHHKNTASA